MLAQKESIEIIRKAMESPSITSGELIEDLITKKLLVQTEDGTYTLRSSQGEELMHSRIGALEEAYEKFVIPSGIAEIESPKILDLCSGLGYNAAAALEVNSQSKLFMVEISREMLYLGMCLPIPCKNKTLLNKTLDDFFQGKSSSNINVNCGDARSILCHTEERNFDAIFHDGFSPGNDPVLYSVEFLKVLKGLLTEEGVLLSYSSSIPFRSSLLEAGFHIGEGPAVGRKRGITIASPSLKGIQGTKRLSMEDEMLIALSTAGVPFRDPALNSDTQSIIDERDRERDIMRDSGLYLSGKKIKSGNFNPDFLLIREENTSSLEAVREMKKKLSIDN